MNNKRSIAATSLFALTLCGASSAQAQFAAKSLGTAGQLTVSAERIFGLSVINAESEDDNNPNSKEEFSATQFRFLLSANERVDFDFPALSSIPRVGLDYFVTDNLSIGIAGGVAVFNGTEEESNGDEEDNSSTVFAVNPRIGYYLGFSETFGLWLRGGVTIINANGEEDDGGTTEFTVNALQVGGEGMFALMPVDGLLFLFGPTFEVIASGTIEVESGGSTSERDLSGTNFGGYFGIGGAFDL